VGINFGTQPPLGPGYFINLKKKELAVSVKELAIIVFVVVWLEFIKIK
jgi:hypothetical protein